VLERGGGALLGARAALPLLPTWRLGLEAEVRGTITGCEPLDPRTVGAGERVVGDRVVGDRTPDDGRRTRPVERPEERLRIWAGSAEPAGRERLTKGLR
jgi:hypothetical protein